MGRNPSHTFTTMDIGTRTIDLVIFDTQSNSAAIDQILVNVVAPDLQ